MQNHYYSFLIRFSYLYYNQLQHSYRVLCNIYISLKNWPFTTENVSEFKILMVISRTFAVNKTPIPRKERQSHYLEFNDRHTSQFNPKSILYFSLRTNTREKPMNPSSSIHRLNGSQT